MSVDKTKKHCPLLGFGALAAGESEAFTEGRDVNTHCIGSDCALWRQVGFKKWLGTCGLGGVSEATAFPDPAKEDEE